MVRQETAQYPEVALREMLLNPMIQEDYPQGADIQMEVYTDKLYFGMLEDLQLASQ